MGTHWDSHGQQNDTQMSALGPLLHLIRALSRAPGQDPTKKPRRNRLVKKGTRLQPLAQYNMRPRHQREMPASLREARQLPSPAEVTHSSPVFSVCSLTLDPPRHSDHCNSPLDPPSQVEERIVGLRVQDGLRKWVVAILQTIRATTWTSRASKHDPHRRKCHAEPDECEGVSHKPSAPTVD